MTTVERREDGAWKVVHRHGDELELPEEGSAGRTAAVSPWMHHVHARLTPWVLLDLQERYSMVAEGSVRAGERSAAGLPGRRQLRRAATWSAHPVPAAVLAAGALHLLWVWLVATSGGDLAAQDAWAEFARLHPGSAYNLAWYGGMHPVSYSAISPYVMATLGVRTTMVLAGSLSAGLLALLLVRSNALHHPLWPALYGAVAFTGNAASGRVTFGLGIMFGLAALTVIFGPDHWRFGRLRPSSARAVLAGVLSALATASSPVAGLFLGVVAAALWLERRRAAAYAIGLPPVAVVAVSAWLFPFSGQQPMAPASTILPIICGACCVVLTPRTWRTVRLGSALYAVAVVLVWLIPSPIGSNITRLGLLFAGVVLVSVLAQARPLRHPILRLKPRGPARSWTALALAGAITTSSIWQMSVAAKDAVGSRPTVSWTVALGTLVHQLEVREADQSRVEVVPAKSHREASALAPYVNLARGWNRQADAERNPVFYTEGLLNPTSYRAWLDRWAVKYVVLPTGRPDGAGEAESHLVAAGLSYLREVWSDRDWRLFEVVAATPLADPPATVTRFDATEVVLEVSSPGTVLVRIPDSPWLSLVDAKGQALEAPKSASPGAAPVNVHGCLTVQRQATAAGHDEDAWTLLHAPKAGIYRIAAPYKLPRGTACPEGMVE